MQAVGWRTQLHLARKKRSFWGAVSTSSGFSISKAFAKGRKPEAARDRSPEAFRAFGKAFGTENRSRVGLRVLVPAAHVNEAVRMCALVHHSCSPVVNRPHPSTGLRPTDWGPLLYIIGIELY